MRCETRIVLGRVNDALTVPVQSVFNEGMLRFVYVREGSLFDRRPVRVGRRSDTEAEILAGLSAGERVLLREPAPNEVLNKPWSSDELALVGLRLDEQGNIVRDPSAGRGGPSGGAPSPEGGASASTAGTAPDAQTSTPATTAPTAAVETSSGDGTRGTS